VGNLPPLDQTPAARFRTGPDRSRHTARVQLSGRSHGLVCGGNDIVGVVDQSAPCRLRERDHLIGGDLLGCRPPDAFVAGLALLDRDLGLPLRPHADDSRGSGKTRVVGCGISRDVRNVDGRDHAEMKGLDGVNEVDAAGELVGRGPSVLGGGGSRDRGADLAGCGDERGVGAAGWAGEFALAFGQAAPGHLVCLERRRQPLQQVAVDMAGCGGGFGDDACGAGDERLHARHPH
jgi:hypothetical protein